MLPLDGLIALESIWAKDGTLHEVDDESGKEKESKNNIDPIGIHEACWVHLQSKFRPQLTTDCTFVESHTGRSARQDPGTY